MDGDDAERTTRTRADELYWSSDMSVSQIAEELDVSKGMLYEMIRPHATAQACPECGEELAYPNRTARARGLVACAACGWEGDEDEVEAFGDGSGLETPRHEEPSPFEWPSRNRVMLGGAFLGAAAGLALVLWTRRR
jgi:predicted RNA-binding Zn-ribbon protein involved in translation (DUF1610 family)